MPRLNCWTTIGPVNSRELCNAIQQAAILAQGGDLDFNLPVDGRKTKMDWRGSVVIMVLAPDI
jgi:hypothetical protein